MENLHNAPIGIFDSGVGGLSVYLHLKARLPNEKFVYFADTKNVPYGNKSSDEIIRLSEQAVEFLVQQGAKLVIVACNSASAYALPSLRAKFNLPIVGLVPAIKPACTLTKTGKIAVLATQATLDGRLLKEVIDDYATPTGIEVYKHFEPKLVPWVESGMPIDNEVADLLIQQMHAWLADGVDTLVLGCTHYPFFKAFLEENIQKNQHNMLIIDSGIAIAERTYSLLVGHQLNNTATQTNQPLQMFISSEDKSSVHQTAIQLTNQPISLGEF